MSEINTNTMFFQSEANQVSVKIKDGRQYVEKKYFEKLKDYPVKWPLKRAEVEAFLLTFLPEILEEKNIFIPMLYHFQKPNTLQMEYCSGTPLIESSIELLYQKDLWQNLFSFLYQLKEIDLAGFCQPVKEALCKQQIIFDCMKHWKFNDYIDPPHNSYGCLVLGDMSLSNILISSKGMTLLDFECAHWGYLGYDIGQILGMLDAYRDDAKLKIILMQAMDDAISDQFYQECCFYWRKRFAEYYRNKKNRMLQK